MNINDKVAVLDDTIYGKIVKMDGDEITVETSEGFDIVFNANELVVIDGSISKKEMLPQNVSQIINEKSGKKPGKSIKQKPKDRVLPAMEVDLHINQLVPKSKHLSNHEMLTIQIDTAKRQLDFAISKRIQRVVFIHGVGEGVLRTEMEYLFNRYKNVKFYDADYQKYGRGATEVYIFQNVKPEE